MFFKLRRLPLLLALCVLSATTSSAWAAVVAVSPVRVHLSDDKQSELLEIDNNGVESARFQITAYTWRQSEDGKMILEPTKDLVFFPSIFNIDAGQSRRVRVASVLRRSRSERAYRLIIEELPNSGNNGGMVRVLTRLNLPVFVQTQNAVPRPVLEASLVQGRLSVVLGNRGTAYFKGAALRIVARSEDGQVLFEQSLPAWYVLAGGRRVYPIEFPKEACGALSSVVVVAETEHGAVRSRVKVTPETACRR